MGVTHVPVRLASGDRAWAGSVPGALSGSPGVGDLRFGGWLNAGGLGDGGWETGVPNAANTPPNT